MSCSAHVQDSTAQIPAHTRALSLAVAAAPTSPGLYEMEVDGGSKDGKSWAVCWDVCCAVDCGLSRRSSVVRRRLHSQKEPKKVVPTVNGVPNVL